MKKLREFLMTVVLFFVLVISALVSLLRTPFDYLAYRRSHFYADFKQKYRLFVCAAPEYRLYNLIRKHDLPILYIPKNPEAPSLGGWFLYKGTLIVHDLRQLSFDEKTNRWVFYSTHSGSGPSTPMMEHIMASVAAVNNVAGHEECTRMFIPLHTSQIVKRDLDKARHDFRFVLYDKEGLEEILSAYIATHPFG